MDMDVSWVELSLLKRPLTRKAVRKMMTLNLACDWPLMMIASVAP